MSFPDKLDGAKCAISKSVRIISPDGHLINETEVSIVGDTLEECYRKYLLVKNDE